MNHNTLYKLILSGDEVAAKEFIKRCKEYRYSLNPIKGNSKQTLFQLIIRRDLTDIAIYFMENGVEINTKDKFGNTPLHEAAKNGNKILIEQLLARGGNPFICDTNGRTAGMLAVCNGHTELAHRLHSAFLLKYPNLIFLPSELSRKSKSQDEPLDLSKTGIYTKNVNPTFFKLNKPSKLLPTMRQGEHSESNAGSKSPR